MGFSDILINLVAPGSPLSLVGVASARSQIYDFAGVGAGNAPPNIFGNVALFGQPDAQGIPLYRMEWEILLGAANFVGAGVSLNIQLQYAADLGTPTYQPNTWITQIESGPIVVGSLLANLPIFKAPMVPPFPANLRPRFVSLNFVMTGGMFTTGSIAEARQVPGRDDLSNRYQAANYKAPL